MTKKTADKFIFDWVLLLLSGMKRREEGAKSHLKDIQDARDGLA